MSRDIGVGGITPSARGPHNEASGSEGEASLGHRWASVKNTARPTIGFLTANVHMGAARSLWPGILDAAEAGDANLICYPGGRLLAPEDLEAQRNLVYDLVNPETLDGLVSWVSTFAGPMKADEVVEFHRRFESLPIVSLASPVGRGSMVSIDGDQGMHALISHLVDVHHYRKIALICGPEGHPYAKERHRVYLGALREKGLTPNPALITPNVSWEKGSEAMQVLLDERALKPGDDFEAVVATSDLLAIGAVNILSERGIRVPADVAVVGFNDIEEGRLIRPPLTSVSLPFYEQGRRSVGILLAGLTGEALPGDVVLDSRLLVRQSCGCPSESVDLAAARPLHGGPADLGLAVEQARARLIEQLGRVGVGARSALDWADRLLDSLTRDLDEEAGSDFLAALDVILQQRSMDGDETAAWQAALSALRGELLPALEGRSARRAEDLLGQGRVVVGEAVQRAQIGRQLRAERQNRMLREIGQALITTFDVVKLCDVLSERLPDLGIGSCYLSLYEDPASPMEMCRLVLAYSGGRRARLGTGGRLFPTRQFLPPDLWPAQRHSLVVEPLYFRTEPLGFVVFEVGPRDGATYEVLRGHISSALKGALLFREAQDARLVAERADEVKTRLLTNVSHELRTPLNIIISHTHRLLLSPPPGLAKDLEHIQHSAEHQLRIINDLLDLSRAEINALDLYPVVLDPRPLIEDAFAALAEDVSATGDVVWRLQLPEHMPDIKVDPVRLRQILLNLLSNAAKFTDRGEITLGARPEPPNLHIWVADTGAGVPAELLERIFEPFFTHERADQPASGIGLGLSITRHLVALHGGTLVLDSRPGQGSTFHLYLPLPQAGEPPLLSTHAEGAELWLISEAETPPAEIADFSRSKGLTIRRVGSKDDLDAMLSTGLPAAIAWNVASTMSGDWRLIRRLQNHPGLGQVPFVLFQPAPGDGPGAGLTSLVVKPATTQALLEAIRPTLDQGRSGSILIIDDDDRARQSAGEAVRRGLPGFVVRTAADGESGLAAMSADPPTLVVLDLMMPGIDGFDVLDRMRSEERTRRIPVVIMSGRLLSLADVKRLERHASVVLQSKGMLSEDEVIAALHRSLFGAEALPPQTSSLAKQAVAYLHQNYALPLKRWEIAEGVGASEDYLSRVFSRELGISPWDYLNRYRILRAKELLRVTYESIGSVASKVGFPDPAYFSRVFRRITGSSPKAYRDELAA